jgi:hypothetical protein
MTGIAITLTIIWNVIVNASNTKEYISETQDNNTAHFWINACLYNLLNLTRNINCNYTTNKHFVNGEKIIVHVVLLQEYCQIIQLSKGSATISLKEGLRLIMIFFAKFMDMYKRVLNEISNINKKYNAPYKPIIILIWWVG